MPKCDFNKVVLNGCSPVNLLHIFRKPFYKNTYGGLLDTDKVLNTSLKRILKQVFSKEYFKIPHNDIMPPRVKYYYLQHFRNEFKNVSMILFFPLIKFESS